MLIYLNMRDSSKVHLAILNDKYPELSCALTELKEILHKNGLGRYQTRTILLKEYPQLCSILDELRTQCKQNGISYKQLAEFLGLPTDFFSLQQISFKGRSSSLKIQHEIGEKRTTKAGYIQVYVGKDYPGAPQNGWILEHRKVMQETIGRILKDFEFVHHRDRVKSHNVSENLEILTSADHPTCMKCPYFLELQELKSKM